MDERLALFILFGVIAAGYLVLFAISRRKQRERAAFLERMDAAFRQLGAEPVGYAWRWRGRAYTIDADASPLLKRHLSLRLAALAPGTAEFELKRADNVPLEMPDPLRSHPFYRDYVVTGSVAPEVQGYLLKVADTLAATLPGRWTAFSHRFVERILFGNLLAYDAYDADALRYDLGALAALAEVPLERDDRPARFTIRHGFEKDVPGWHWTPEERLRWAEQVSRTCVSAYHGSPLLNAALLRIFRTLAGSAPLRYLSNHEPSPELMLAYGDLTTDAAAVAADAFMDGAFFGGAIAGGEPPQVPPYERHRKVLEMLGDCVFYVRRLRDDEDSWYSGEYEILSQKVNHARVEEVVRGVAREFGAEVTVIDRPFLPKLLKEDRLDMAP